MIRLSIDLAELQDKPENTYIKSDAYCTSIICVRRAKSIKSTELSSNGVKKHVNVRHTMCPDCGHALWWKKITKKYVRKPK